MRWIVVLVLVNVLANTVAMPLLADYLMEWGLVPCRFGGLLGLTASQGVLLAAAAMLARNATPWRLVSIVVLLTIWSQFRGGEDMQVGALQVPGMVVAALLGMSLVLMACRFGGISLARGQVAAGCSEVNSVPRKTFTIRQMLEWTVGLAIILGSLSYLHDKMIDGPGDGGSMLPAIASIAIMMGIPFGLVALAVLWLALGRRRLWLRFLTVGLATVSLVTFVLLLSGTTESEGERILIAFVAGFVLWTLASLLVVRAAGYCVVRRTSRRQEECGPEEESDSPCESRDPASPSVVSSSSMPVHVSVAIVLAVLTQLLGAPDARCEDATKPLLDKTLVVWAAPENLAQRGGSVLTLIDKAEHFDAVVLGEAMEGKWMAGSDFFRRTQHDQAKWPTENAGASELVQMAIVYRGNRITLYRNGKEYATYSIGRPQPFGADALVLIGLRFIGSMEEIGFFSGAIEDARIYDTALAADQIAALAPNKPSHVKPLAWWTFEEGKADDAMKTYPASRLVGTARIVGGRLILDGDGYLCAAKDARLLPAMTEEETSFDASVQNLFYKARSRRTGNMWDTWLYHHQGQYYLYYLGRSRGQWDNFSMARSPDGVYWTELGRVLPKRRGVTWMGTGSTWKSPHFEKDSKYFMNFSEWKGPRQTIFFAESKDLLHWSRLGDEYQFVQDERWYEKNGRWDCIWTIPRPGGGYYGYWTATPKAETGGRFGFGETLDGITWKALPPPKVSGVGEGEVGAIEKIGGKYYMMFGTNGVMVTLVADRPEGPFAAAKKNLRLLAGHTYFARFFPMPDGVLVNHHSIARDGQVYFGTLKATSFDAEGTLRLGWWPGNEKLKRQAIDVKLPLLSSGKTPAIAMIESSFDAQNGLVLEGALKLPASRESQPVGLFLLHGNDSGTGILVRAGGVTELGPMRADGAGFKAESRIDREWNFGPTARFRLLLKGSLLEFYLDDLLIECYSLPQKATGRIGFLPAGDPAAVSTLKAWRPSQSQP